MGHWKTAVAIGAVGVAALAALASAPILYARLETARLWYEVIGVDV